MHLLSIERSAQRAARDVELAELKKSHPKDVQKVSEAREAM